MTCGGAELLHTREVGLTQKPGTLAEAPRGYFCHHYPSEQEESPASVSDLKSQRMFGEGFYVWGSGLGLSL